ncbi:hypothetical protein [Shinella zoogloeoides]|uniref:hypothetical protein n=1 Tax=Shinella zoogloeoides TaxID=352475 RepID=UPI00299E893E|nr:hypothetical protein [Shinella zoogloeoides]WPE19844.1 hypothetical protein ShzoTeo12_10200 [Shinella zoogloeoides]
MTLSSMREFYEENRQNRAIFTWVHSQGTFDYDDNLEIVMAMIVDENPHGRMHRKSVFTSNGEQTISPEEFIALQAIQRQIEADR